MNKVILLLALLVPAAGCASARAQVPPEDHPALVVPPVPPRAIDPLPPETPAIEPVGDLPPAPSTNPPRPRPQQRETRPPANDSKPEAKPTETPTEPPAGTPPPPAPVPPLRPPGTPDGPEMAKQVRDTLDRADKILGTVDYRALKSDSRANYDNAKSFMKQAEDLLKANNLVAAKLLADRAENIAKQLKQLGG